MDDEDMNLPAGANHPTPLPEPHATARANLTVRAPRAAADSVRRSEAYLAAQIARAVARGQRML